MRTMRSDGKFGNIEAWEWENFLFMKRLLVFKFAEVEEEIKKNSGFMSFFADLLRVESIVC